MRKSLAVIFAAAMFFVAACGDDDVSRDDALDELVETGLNEEQANCLLDKMDDLGIDYGADEDDVPEDKQDEFLEAAGDCATP